MRKASLLRLMLPIPGFRWHSSVSAERTEVEDYIASKFRQEYAAELSSFAPLLLSMHCKNELSAAVGIRPASSGPLFVEQYLDKPIEHCIKATDSSAIQRDEIVEIGNLVTTRRGASQLLFIVLGSLMYEAGYRWLVFSASDPGRLGDHAGEWGSYYETSPKVIVGDIRVAYEKAQNSRLLRMALTFYRPLLRRLLHNMPAAV